MAQQPETSAVGNLVGPVLQLDLGKWAVAVAGYYGEELFHFDLYQNFLTGPDGQVQTDSWGDPFVFEKKDLDTKVLWQCVEGSVSFRIHKMLSLTANGLYRRFERTAQPITAYLYTVDFLRKAKYDEGKIETQLPAYKNEGMFAGGGVTLEIPVWNTPISVNGSAVLLTPIDTDQDLRFIWQTGVAWNDLAGFSFLFGYRDEFNAHDLARERIRGAALMIEYKI